MHQATIAEYTPPERKPAMRVLIVAENASAKFGGEAFLPLHYFRMLRSRHIEAWLVTHARTQAELEALLPEERDRMFFVPDTWLHRWLFHCGKPLAGRVSFATVGMLSNLYTQMLLRRLVRHLTHEKQIIEVVHQPSPVRLQMGRAGLERVRQHFDWERKTDRILEVYQDKITASQNQTQNWKAAEVRSFPA